jgi:hypothetical protein
MNTSTDITGSEPYDLPILKFRQYIPEPIPAGWYIFGNVYIYGTLQIALAYKPNWFHRLCMRVFLGIYWIDNKQ